MMREIKRRQRGFADLELLRQARMDPVLQQIGEFLDTQGDLLNLVHRDLTRHLKNRRAGRTGLSAEQVVRAFVLMRVKNWDYRELAERIADGYSLRLFTCFESSAVPRHDAFQRSFIKLQAETMRRFNNLLVDATVQMRLGQVHKLRLDTTAVETDVRYPQDSGMLWDTVRVLNSMVEKIGTLVPAACKDFPRRTRRAKRRMQEIARMCNRKIRERQHRNKYRDLIRVTVEVIEKAEAVARHARKSRLDSLLDGLQLDALCNEVKHFAALGRRVIDQTERRVFHGETVPADEKLFSIFETHTDMIKRGKAHKPVEFGHKVLLVESRIGLITDYKVLDGNPVDADELVPSVKRHINRFGKAPEVFAGDRGFYETSSCEKARQLGVKLLAIGQRGGKKTAEQESFEKSRAYKQAQAFRSGIEGRISVLFRGRGMKRCLWSGRDRFEVFIATAILANNLMVIAAQLQKRKKRKAPPLPIAA